MGNRQLNAVLKNFCDREDATAITCGLIFIQEAIAINSNIVDPREIILSILLALDVLDKGKGVDPGMDWGNNRALEISHADNMTLLIHNSKITPVFNWNNLELTVVDQNIVSQWIEEGRRKIAGKKKPGLVEI